MMDGLWQDVRFGFRMLFKHSGFTAIAVVTLALGIGATTAIFSVVDAVLIKRLPCKDPDRIVAVWEKTPEGHRNSVSSAEFIGWRNQNQVFDSLVAVDGAMFNLSDKGQP